MKNYWDNRAGGEGVKYRNLLFLRIRDLYLNLLKHLYNDQKDIPNVKIYFCTMQRTLEEGIEK